MRNLLYRLKQSTIRFMQGRYGSDKLNMTLLGTSLAFEILFMFTKWQVLNLISLVLITLVVLRMFSKNIEKRYEENRKYEKLLNRLKTLKTHHIYKCPSCHQKIRVPRLHGKRVEIRCPKCGETFIKKV